MSTNTLETVLYDISAKRARRERFKEDADGFLSRYPLSEAETRMIKSMQVREMAELGVNPMLTMGFWLTLQGPASLPDYLRAMAGKR